MKTRSGAQVAAAVAAALLLAGGCAAGMVANKKSPGVVEAGSFKPSRPPAANYGPDPSFTCPDRGVQGLVAEELGGQAKAEGRLCAVADTLLGWPGADENIPPETVLSVISNDFGLPQTVRKVVITNVDTAEQVTRGPAIQGATEQELADSIAQPIRSFASTAVTPRYGVMTDRIKAGQTRVVIVMQDQSLDLKPLPRKLNPGQTAALSGTVLGTLQNPKVQFTDATGNLEKAESKRIIVQITAEQEGAETLLANFPVGCATDLPIAAAIPAAGPETGPVDPATAEKQLATLLNQDRTAAGRKPLQVDPNLSNVARSLSEDRAKGKGTTGEELQKRLTAAEISSPKILASEAQALSPEDAWMKFANSPSDRASAMSDELTDVGIGVAPGQMINNKPVFVVTYLYMKQLPPPNAEEVKANLYQAIAQRRSDARTGPLAKDPQLEGIAQAYASQMAKDKGKVAKEKAAEIEAPLYKSFATVNELGGVKADPMEFAQESGIVGDAKLVGVGVAIGASPQFGKNSTYVVVLVAKKAGAKASAATPKPVKRK